MKKLDISYEDFERHMNAIIRIMKLQGDIYDLVHDYDSESDILFPTLVDNVIELLADLTHDENDNISYWLFDLNCGKDYHDGCITYKNGEIIKLATISDLWNLLTSEKHT